MAYAVAMRLHITLADDLAAELDHKVGARGRSAFISAAVAGALRDQQRWESIEAAIGAISDVDHAWDDDPAAWVRAQRRGDDRRVG